MAVRAQLTSEDRAAGGQHKIGGSLSFRGVQSNGSTDGSDLRRTPSTVGNRRVCTFSCWFKRSNLTFDQQIFYAGSDANNTAHIRFDSDDTITCFDYSNTFTVNPSAKFRDHGWHHLVVAIDTTQASSSNRVKMYYDGVLQTVFDTETYPAQNLELWFNSTNEHSIGRNNVNGNNYLCGSLTTVYWIDGQQLAASEFGFTDELTGKWRPKKFESWPTYVASTELLYGVNTGDNGFDSSSTSRSYDATGHSYAPYSTPQSANPGGYGANSAHVYKSPDGASITWVVSTDTSDRYIWTSSDGQNWSSSGSTYDTDGSAQSVTAAWIALAGGSNSSNVTVTTSTSGYGTASVSENSFYLPMDGNTPLGKDESGRGNDWAAHTVYGKVGFDKGTGGYPILDTVNGGTSAKSSARGTIGIGVSVYNSKYYLDGEEAKTVKFVPGQTVTFDTSDTTVGGHPFRLSGTANGSHNAFYSVDFDGTGDYLSIAESTDWLFEEGDFTVEFWAYIDNIATDGGIVTNMDNFNSSSQYNSRWVIGLYNSELRIWTADDGDHVLHDYNPPQQEWVHYAFTRETGNSFTLYKNGLNIFTATKTSDFDTNGPLLIGYLNGLGTYNGKISDLRIVKGTAVYTSNFCPPFSPLTNISNTKVLCCNSSTTTGYTVSPGAITANGDPTSSDTNPYDVYVYGTATGAISEGTVGAATTITIPSNAPSDLYYYCTNHSGMGGSVSIGATDHSVADPYAWKCVYAAPFVFKTDFSDRVNCTTARKSITVNGGASESLRGNVYGASYDFDGSDDSFETPYEAAFNFGAEQFTIECWAKSTQSSAYGTLVGRWTSPNSTACWDLRMSTADYGDRVAFMTRDDDENFRVLDSGVKANDGEWHHLAVSRTGDDISIFVDGEKKNTLTYTYSNGKINTDTSTSLRIGHGDSSNYFDGRVSDVRIYKGIGKYVNSFAVPSPQPDIVPDTPSGVAYESLLSKPFGTSPFLEDGGSVYFDGTQDYLKTDITLGSGDFTVEYWAKQWDLYNYNSHISVTRGATGWNTGTDSAGGFVWYDQAPATGGGARKIEVLGVIGLNQWQHWCFVRSGSTITGYLDGKAVGTYSCSVDFSSSTCTIGGLDYAGVNTEWHRGWLSNMRITVGQAIYTKDFTPSTKPLTTTSQGAIASNVKLICCQNDNILGAKVSPSIDTSTINNGRVWYPYLSSNSIFKDAGFAFDGDLTTRAQTKNYGSDKTLTFAPVPPVNFTTTLEVYCDQGATGPAPMPTAEWDGNSVEPGSGAWVTVYSGSGTLGPDKPLVIDTNSAGQYATLMGVRIDGVILRDPITWHSDEGGDNPQTQGRVSTDSPFNTINSVRGQETQYSTFNPSAMDNGGTFKNGDLHVRATGPTTIPTSVPMYKGKWYAEFISTAHASTHMGIGIGKVELIDGNRQPDESQHRGGWGLWHISGDGSYKKIGHGGSWGSQSTTWEDWGDTWGTNGDYDVMGLALDMDNRKINFFKNGEDMGSNENGLDKQIDWGTLIDAMGDNGTILPNTSWADGDHGIVFVCGNGQSGATSDFDVNLGQKPFKFTPPPGYQAANLANCYERPTLVRPDKEYFTPVLYTGNGDTTDGLKVTVPFEPDLVWIKRRSTTTSHMLYDSVRGFGVNKALLPNGTYEEGDTSGVSEAVHGFLDTVESNGFRVKAGSSSGVYTNTNGSDYVSWCWKAGGNKGTWNVDGEDRGSAANAGLTAGDTSVLTGCSINTKAGFSIVTYTQDSGGASKNIAHGLSKAPSFVIMKHINNTSNWYVVHTAIENEGKILYLNTDSGQDTSSDFGSAWPGATYTATATTGVSGRQLVLYSWTNTKGLQWFGQYEGNGSATEGPYINLGFKPAMVMLKRVDSTGWWHIFDNKRNPYNVRNKVLFPNSGDGEYTYTGTDPMIDFHPDGFKVMSSYSHVNNGGSKYSYCAWAETPTSVMYGS